jgi:hypothetical protein
MATLVGTQTITIGTQELTLDKAWVPKYHNELKKGNTTVKRDNMATEGYATLRISHQVQKNVRGHVVSLEIEGNRGPDAAPRLVKGQFVLTCTDGEPDETALAKDLTVALCSYLPTVIDDIAESRTD